MSNPFVPYLPRLVREVAAEAEAPSWTSLDGSLLSVDISGFTALSERLARKGKVGAEELILLISGVFEGLIGIAGRRSGDVLKFRGDALLILFRGADHEQRASRAAMEMQWLLETAGTRMSSVGSATLRMAAGIHSGECTFVLAGSTHRELLVVGTAATETVRLESAAGAGEVVVGAATAAALRPAWLGEERDGAVLLRSFESDEDEVVAALHNGHDDSPAELEAFVPAPLRAPLASAAIEAEHRQVTAAFVKFSGVDALLEQGGPEALVDPLQRLGEVVGDAAAEYGVTWLESDIDADGGKLYLVAGAPSSAGDDEERMLRLLRTVLDDEVPLTLRAGVNRGHAFAGEIGSNARRTYAVMGDVVNLAARLTARATPGQILATGDVLERSRTRFESEQQPFLVKGKERAVTAFHVGTIVGRREEEPDEQLPLVGREEELATLRAAVEAARRRTSQVVELVGEPGIGKSRLVEELKSVAVGFAQLEVRCEPYTASAPYHAFRSILRPLAGITLEQSSKDAGAQLVPWVEAVLPELAGLLPLLAIPFDAEVPPTAEAEQVGAAFRRERVHELVDQFMQRVLMMPTLLVVEDLHWLDDASHQLLLHLTRAPRPSPWLVCVSRRPEGLALNGSSTVIGLEPLAPEATSELVLAATREQPLSEELQEAVASRSGGNPLFVRELLYASSGGNADVLPETVESLLTARIDRLEPGDRLLLRYASVVGPTFDLGLLAEILARQRADPTGLERWERLGEFVAWDGPDVLRFRHDLFRTVAYEGLSFRRRREIHGRVANALAARAGDAVDEQAGLLSLHFARAERWAEAWRYAGAAGRQAQEKHANVVAAELYERALEAAEHLPALDSREIAEVNESLGDVCELFASYDRACTAYAEARRLLEHDATAHARLLYKDGIVRERMGRYEDALELYRQGLDLVPSIGEGATTEAIRLELGIAAARYRQGRYDETIAWARAALEHAEQAADRSAEAHACYLLDVTYTVLGTPDHSFRQRALPIYQEIGDLVGQASVLNNLGIDAYFESRWDEAIQLYTQSGTLSRRAGDVSSSARASSNVAEILSDQGRIDEATELLRDAHRIWRAGRYPVGVHLATSNLGRAAARAGRFAEAHDLFEQALRGFLELGADSFVAETRLRQIECLVFEGRFQEVFELEAPAREAVERVGSPAVLVAQLERLVGYAQHQARRPEDARRHFEASMRLARSTSSYELALTLKALADTGAPEHEAESRALLESLGVVKTPSPPLP